VGKNKGQAIKPGLSHVYGHWLLSLYRLFSVSLPTLSGKPLQEVVSTREGFSSTAKKRLESVSTHHSTSQRFLIGSNDRL
jgi:hypothetical protein